ncbi:MAG TPA: hypothetical protein VF344_07945 [Candidatus Limnocylindrales bacterium]
MAGPVTSLAWSPDGQLLATTPGDALGTGTTATIWTAAGGRVATLAGHTGAITCMAWAPDSRTVASASRDGSVRLWDRTGRLVRALAGADPVLALAWSPDGSVLASGAVHFPAAAAGALVQLPGVVRLWRPDGTRIASMGTELTGGKFLNLAWSPDGTMLAAGAVDYRTWHADGSPVGVLRTGGSPAWAMAWSPDSIAVALGDENGSLQLVSPQGDSIAQTHYVGDVNSVSYSPNGTGIVIGQNTEVQFAHPDDLPGPVWKVPAAAQGRSAWSPDGQRLAIAISDGIALLNADGSALADLGGCPGTPVAFAWAGNSLAATTDQGQLCVWHT